VSESDDCQKDELEYLRLAADCMQLVGEVNDPALQALLLRVVRVLSNPADQGSDADTQSGGLHPDQESKQPE
jgi:hypothetical protein